MKKPWEETWEAELHGNACECSSSIRRVDPPPKEAGIGDAVLFVDDGGRAIQMHAYARLAAAAPEMARVLLDLEYTDVTDGNATWQECPSCGAEGPKLVRTPESQWDGTWESQWARQSQHKPDCAWVAVMRKAGVLT